MIQTVQLKQFNYAKRIFGYFSLNLQFTNKWVFAYLNIHPVSTDINKRGNVFFEEGQLQEKYKPEDVQAKALPLSSYNKQNVIKIQSGFRRMKAGKERLSNKKSNWNIQSQKMKISSLIETVESCNYFVKERLLAYGEDNYNKITDEKSRLLTPYKYGSINGQRMNGLRGGRGKLIYSDGSIYESYFSQDYQHSHWRLIMHLEILRDFQNGKIEWNGTYQYADVKGRIQKEYPKWFWQRNKADGTKIGRFQWTDGSVYEGSVVNDQMEGFGTLCGLIRGNVTEIGKIA